MHCTALLNAIELLLHITHRNQSITVQCPANGRSFSIQGDLLEPDSLLVFNIDAGIGVTRFQRSAVISTIHTKNLAAVAIEPAITQAR